MRRVLLVAAMVACKTPEGDDFPVEPGGPNPDPMGMNVDAPLVDAPDPDAVLTLSGRVCLVGDLRGLACATTGAGNITVTLGTKTAITTDNGSFTITKPGGSNLVWRAQGAGIISSVLAFGPTNTIPAIGVEDYIDLQNANSVIVVTGQGSIVARIGRNGAPVSGAVATVSPVAANATRYDGITPLAWKELATSAAGTAWISGTALGTNVVTVSLGATSVMESVVVEDQSITYVSFDLP